MAHLSAQQESQGKVFALADPDPMTVAELLDELERATGRRLITMPLPLRTAKWAVRHVPGVYRLVGIPAEAIDYFVHPTYYDTTNTMEALRGSGIEAPSPRNYLSNLVSSYGSTPTSRHRRWREPAGPAPQPVVRSHRAEETAPLG